jgi:putative ABC transport system substrate-binding protein
MVTAPIDTASDSCHACSVKYTNAGKMRRRDFIKAIAGSAAAWPLAARAQQAGKVSRIGVLMSLTADDPEGQARLAAFTLGPQQLG